MGSQRNQREDGEGGGAERGPEPLFPRGTLRRHGTQKKGGNRRAQPWEAAAWRPPQ